jgi:hypothetical protein
LALLAWESLGEQRRPAMLALSSTVLAWVSFQWLPAHVSADAQAAFFLAWTVPLAIGLALHLYAPELTRRLTRGATTSARLLPAQEITVSSLDSRVSTS